MSSAYTSFSLFFIGIILYLYAVPINQPTESVTSKFLGKREGSLDLGKY